MKTTKRHGTKETIRAIYFKRLAIGSKFFGSKVTDIQGRTYEKIHDQVHPYKKIAVVNARSVEANPWDQAEYKYFTPHESVLPVRASPVK